MTYLQLVNSVLARLRETSVATVATTSYSSLIGKDFCHYIYAHIRNDTGNIFYIGKGCCMDYSQNEKGQ